MNYAKETEWADLKVAIDGKPVTGIRNIKYKEAHEDEPLYAAGRKPIGIQTGNIAYTGSITLLKNELDALNLAARNLGYDNIAHVPNIVITAAYLPAGTRILKTDIILGAKISEQDINLAQGAKMVEIALPFNFLDIKQS